MACVAFNMITDNTFYASLVVGGYFIYIQIQWISFFPTKIIGRLIFIFTLFKTKRDNVNNFVQQLRLGIQHVRKIDAAYELGREKWNLLNM